MRAVILALCLACTRLHAEFFFTPDMIHLESYTEEEVRLIEKDLKTVRSICLEDTEKSETLFFLATAGAPGSRKTTILERFIAAHPEVRGGVYLDSDTRVLKYMGHTYYAQSLPPFVIGQSDDYMQVIRNAYNKWHYAADYIMVSLFEEAVAASRSITFGVTSTGAHVPRFLAKMKEAGYKIILLLCSCPDELRREAVEYRNNVIRFYQSSPEDTLVKGKLFPQRMWAYFAHADLMYFYWSDELFSPERLAAIWQNGQLEIRDPEAMQRFIDKYEEDRAALALEGEIIPPFERYLCK